MIYINITKKFSDSKSININSITTKYILLKTSYYP